MRAANAIVRNLKSVGIQLEPHMKSGLLRMYSGRTDAVKRGRAPAFGLRR